MKIKDVGVRLARKLYRNATQKKFLPPECDIERQSVNEKILKLLKSEFPCMISRFGTTEINCLNNYLCISSRDNYFLKLKNFVTDNTHTPWWNTDHFHYMNIYSGIFPEGEDTAVNFSKRYIQDIPYIDMIGCHQYYEKFMPLREDVSKVQLEMLYPFFVNNPWTAELEGKKVLVVHPFDETIKRQYKIKERLFDNVLPEFELLTLKAVQSVAGEPVPYNDWFEALKYMEDSISKINFDIALLGCGAYGLPLAAHVKRIGKSAVHLGGGLQLLFGIKGKRWESQYQKVWHYRPGQDIDIDYGRLFNEHWVYPSEDEKPKNAEKVEGGCYW